MKFLHVILILAAIAATQIVFGGGDGSRLIYTLPGSLLLGLSGVLAIFSLRKAPARMDRASLITAIGLAVYLFARIAFSPSKWLAGFDFYALLPAVIVYFLAALFVRGSGARLATVCGILLLAVGQVAIGIYQFAKNANFHPLVSETRVEAGFRASGTYISPNHLAGFLEVALLLAAGFAFFGGFRTGVKMVFGYLALICLTGLVLTGSRGGYLSAGVGVTVFAVASAWAMRFRLSGVSMRRIVAIVAAIVVLGGTLVAVGQRSFAIRTRANNVFIASDVRFRLWKAAWEQFRLAPVFGTGSRTYVYYGRMFRAPDVQADPVFVHSDWLQALAEYGIVGVLLLLAAAFAHLRHGWRRWAELARMRSVAISQSAGKHERALLIGTISAVAAVLAHAMIDFNLHIQANLLLAAFLFGMLATRETEEGREPVCWSARALHALPAGLGLWLLLIGVPRVSGELFAENARGRFASGDIRAGLEDAGRAIARGIRNPNLYYMLGEVQRIVGQNIPNENAKRFAIEDALEQYAEALAIFPQDVGIVLRNAWALDRLGRFDEAGPLIARGKELDPKSPMPWIFGMLHWKMRDKPAEALADYRKALALGYGWIPVVLGELQETFDPAVMEGLLQQGRPADPK